jgi:uncharacterized protein YndB with AHSA1/START domain
MAMTDQIRIAVSRDIDAAPNAVFDAWLDAESTAQWLFATPGGVMERVIIDPHVGGAFEVFERRGTGLAEHYGTYVEIDRSRRLSFDFRAGAEGPATRVTVDIAAANGGSKLTLTHDGVWPDYEERTRTGWAMMLDGLARALGKA